MERSSPPLGPRLLLDVSRRRQAGGWVETG